MSTIANDDLFLARRANTLYKVYGSNVRNGSDTDQYLVQRGSDLHYVEMADMFNKIQNTDTMMVWDTSVGQLCKVTGQDARNFLFPTYDIEFLVVGSGGNGGPMSTTGPSNRGSSGHGGAGALSLLPLSYSSAPRLCLAQG